MLCSNPTDDEEEQEDERKVVNHFHYNLSKDQNDDENQKSKVKVFSRQSLSPTKQLAFSSQTYVEAPVFEGVAG